MPRKRILVDVDENQWAALKGQAEVEGRFVRVLLAEALSAYLARKAVAGVPQFQVAPALQQDIQDQWDRKPTVENLRALVETVKPATWADKIGTKPKDLAFVSAVAERQAWLRDHPEDEQQ